MRSSDSHDSSFRSKLARIGILGTLLGHLSSLTCAEILHSSCQDPANSFERAAAGATAVFLACRAAHVNACHSPALARHVDPLRRAPLSGSTISGAGPARVAATGAAHHDGADCSPPGERVGPESMLYICSRSVAEEEGRARGARPRACEECRAVVDVAAGQLSQSSRDDGGHDQSGAPWRDSNSESRDLVRSGSAETRENPRFPTPGSKKTT